MTIEDADSVDYISLNDRAEVELTISDHLDWNHTHKHLSLLQSKVYRYLDFVSSGEFSRTYAGSDKATSVVIRIRARHQYPSEGIALLENLRRVAVQEGVAIEISEPREEFGG